MKNNEILSYSFGTKYAYMPKDVKHTLNQMYNDRLKQKGRREKFLIKEKEGTKILLIIYIIRKVVMEKEILQIRRKKSNKLN